MAEQSCVAVPESVQSHLWDQVPSCYGRYHKVSKQFLVAGVVLPDQLTGLHSCRKRSKAADWDTVEATPAMNSWEATPGATPAAHWEATPGATPAAHWDATPGATPGAGSRWDATPTPGRAADGPTPRRNRWDETPTPGRVRLSHMQSYHAMLCLL